MRDKERGQSVITAVLMILLGCMTAWAAGRITVSRTAPAKEQEAEEQTDMPEITKEQEALAEQLYSFLSGQNFPAAAAFMEEHREAFGEIFYEALQGEAWLYDENGWSRELEGDGMVFRKGTLVFLGEFEHGKPEGSCLAFQVLDMEIPRYDYSMGQWKNGKMDGVGVSGYHCYTETGEEAPFLAEKRGTFKAGLLDGPFVYAIQAGGREETTWSLEAEDGRMVLDDLWEYDEEEHVYRLRSYEDGNTGYSVREEEVGTVRWKNLLEW